MSEEKYKLLLIEDKSLTRKLIIDHLTPEGCFEVDSVDTGKKGLEKLKKIKYDAILLDIELPDYDDKRDKTKLLKKIDSSKFSIIIITAVGSEELAVETIRLGAVDYIKKKGDWLEELGCRVREKIEKIKMQKELEQKTKNLETLRKISHSINSTPEFEKTIDLIGKEVKDLIPNDHTYLVIFHEDGTYETYIDEKGNYIIEDDLTNPKKSINGWIYNNKKPFLTRDIHNDPRTKIFKKASVQAPGLNIDKIESILGVPIFIENELIGSLVMGSFQKDHFTKDNLDLLEMVSTEVAIAINLAQIYKRSEEKYKTLFNNTVPTFIMDRDLYLIECNKQFKKLMGYTKKDINNKILNKVKGTDFVDKRYKDLVNKKHNERIERFVPPYKSIIVRKDGKKKNVKVYGGVIPNTKTTIISFIDITEEKKMEEILEEESQLAYLGTLAGSIAHEILTPISIIYQSSEFILEEDDLNEIKKEADEIHNQTYIIENTINELREYVKLREELVDINTTIKKSLKNLKNNNNFSKISVIEEYKVKSQISGTKLGIEQIFINILKNAVQAVEKKEKKEISIKTFEDNDFVIVEISDTGVGIPEENLNDIFLPLFTTRSHEKGMGFGLTLVKKNIERINGKIEVESQLNKGTTFRIKISKKVKKYEKNEN